MPSVASPASFRMILLVLLVGIPALPSPGRTADFDPDREARRIFTTVMSPYCPGLTLADCGSSGAAVLRDSIRAQLRRGRPPQEILDELVAVFGPNVLALPPNEGAGRVAWLGPVAALLVGLGFVVWWVRRRGTPQPSAAPPPERPRETDPSLREKLQEELRRFD